MTALVYTAPIENNSQELKSENKVIKERLNNLGSLITSMEDFEKERQPNPAFTEIINEIQKVLQKYQDEADKRKLQKKGI